MRTICSTVVHRLDPPASKTDPRAPAARRLCGVAALAAIAAVVLSGCTAVQAYRTQRPLENLASGCVASSAVASPPSGSVCAAPATEKAPDYTLHFVEFDDEGNPFDNASWQIDSAVSQIKAQLQGSNHCVRLFVYVHGWRHDASPGDQNVDDFKSFLAEVGRRTRTAGTSAQLGCEDATIARPSREHLAGQPLLRREVDVVGIYVGWRGLSITNTEPLVYTSFWDRKNTADRVAQGSVRELFGRLSALASYAPTADRHVSALRGTSAQLRTYVIAHSFGASVAFRALSQSLIDSFVQDLDESGSTELSIVSRFIDMVVLVNPAIEAARFAPLFRAAEERPARCLASARVAGPCTQPRYQAPVLAIFTSEGDRATKIAFPLGTGLSNAFERTVDTAEKRSIVQTVGWDERYRTHTLTLQGRCDPASANPYEVSGTGLRYRAPGWTWCFDGNGTGTMALTQLGRQDSSDSAPYNGPLWNVQVSKEIISDHTDIWNDRFRSVLLRFFTDEQGTTQQVNITLTRP